jgi:uncharacterized protein (TIGR02145 family)
MMRNFFNILFNMLCICILLGLLSCQKEEEQQQQLVKVTTVPVYQITRTSAYFEGSVIDEGMDTVISYGFCWNTTPQPTFDDKRIALQQMSTGNSTNGTYKYGITGLLPGTNYYLRAYAITVESKIYGNEETFTSKTATAKITFNPDLTYQSISDIDGNTYKTIYIGDQQWMAENLKTTRLNDGTEIPFITDNILWYNLKSPAYSWYNNDEAIFKNIYGGYYNWYAVNFGKLCPSGWHVPDESDWKALKVFLGMTPEQADSGFFTNNKVGIKIKETGTYNWVEESTTATNESGFTALPGGSHFDYSDNDTFGGEGGGGGWWSASLVFPSRGYAYSHWVTSYSDNIFRSDMLNSTYGLNVRCIKD